MKGIKIEGPKVKLTGRKRQDGRRPTAYTTRRVKGRDRQAPQVVVVQDGPRRWFRRGHGPEPLPVYVTDPATGHDQQRPSWDWKGSTLFRNGRILTPWLVPAACVLTSVVLQLAATIADTDLGRFAGAVGVATLAAALIAARLGTGQLDRRWRPRVYAWAVIGPAWLAWTVADGITRTSLATLILATVAITVPWWRLYGRRDSPTRKPPKREKDKPVTRADTPPAEDDIIGNLIHYGDRQGGPCKDWRFENPNITEERSRWDVLIPPGDDSLEKVHGRQDTIATAARRHAEDLIIERHPSSKDSARIRLTVVTRSPVADGVDFTEPRFREDGHNAWIDLGPYQDGDGVAPLRLWTENSAQNALIVANRGGGKSTLLNAIGLSGRASRKLLIWYLDGNGGSSSPILRTWSDWAPGGASRPEVLAAGQRVLEGLERLAELRRWQMKREDVSGLAPTPRRPFVLAVVDEAHVFFNDTTTVERWTNLLRTIRPLAIGVLAATQGTKVNSFGDESDIKEFLGGDTTLVGRLRSGQAKGLLNIAYDPSTLPRGGGWFYLDSGEERSAPFRAWRSSDTRSAPGVLDSDADKLYARYPGGALEPEALNGMPEFYRRRDELAAVERERLHAGAPGHAPAQPVSKAPAAPTDSRWNPDYHPTLHAVPSPTTPSMPAGLTGRQQDVWSEVAAGRAKVAEIAAELNCGTTTVYDAIAALTEAGHVREAGRGRYEVTD